MKAHAFFVALALLLNGCTAAKVAHRPAPSDTLPGSAPDEDAGRSCERALSRYLGSSRFVQLDLPRFSSDGTHDYVSFRVQYATEGGWEGIYHTQLLFVKKKSESNWAAARIYDDPNPYGPPFTGPSEILEQKGRAFWSDRR